MAFIEIKNLSFTYPNQTEAALSDLCFCVQEGEFLTLIGASGSGKTTLLRLLKPSLAPHGDVRGTVTIFGQELSALDERTAASHIGFVMQNPDSQIVTDKVWHELAFGLENMGVENGVIRRRVAEMAAFFGIEEWFSKDVNELSGGQKQLLNLASVMVMQPRILLLDEPTAQLDPIAATDFLNAVKRIQREFGTSVILSEHRLEEAVALSDRVLALERGKIIALGKPEETAAILRKKNSSIYRSMPTSVRLCGALTVGDARQWLKERLQEKPALPIPARTVHPDLGTALAMKHVCFRYEKQGKNVLNDASCRFAKGQLTAILGGNGSGKSTTLSLLSGLRKAQSGKISNPDSLRCALLPQDVQMLFVAQSVYQELADVLRGENQENSEAQIQKVEILCKLGALRNRHPFDLSGGEMQRLALAKLLLALPDILLLDEPTKGLDAQSKRDFARILQTLLAEGKTVIMVSHDVEFCASYADACMLMFDGEFIAQGSAAEFFSGNCFYTTAANRIAGNLLPEAVTCDDLLAACGVTEPDFSADDEVTAKVSTVQSAPMPVKPRPIWIAVCAAALFAIVLLLFLQIATPLRLAFLERLPKNVMYGILTVSLLLLFLCVSRRAPAEKLRKRKWNVRTWIALLMPALTIPATILAGVYLFDGKQYLLISLLVLVQMMLPFVLLFEKRHPSARELVLLAVLAALAVAGRAAFYALPSFKPVLALVIISGIALGGESGFLVGALAMLLSNMIFGQGPWTPWQMLAMGLCGFLAGILYRNGILRRSRLSLCVFGTVCAIVIYGVLMNISSAFTWYSQLSWKTVFAYCASGFPMDVMHGASTCLFLWIFGEPMLKKMDRICLKYGIMVA